MIARYTIFITVLLFASGCNMPWQRRPAVHRDPAFPMTLSCEELVAALNQQCRGLQSWKCSKTKLHIRLPNGLRQRLSGALACESPNNFRLTANNTFVKTDFGANHERCWFYSNPGESAVMTWMHEDTAMLQHLPGGIPYLDPDWLMVVLGIKPLDANDYTVSSDPMGSPELWLTAIEDTPSGRPVRRLIKVDTMNGVVREHALFDSEANPLVRAVLSDYKSCHGNQLAQKVKLMFPQMDFEMTLTFDDIDVNPSLSDRLWQLPTHSAQVVDVGRMLKDKLVASGRLPQRKSVEEHPFYVPPETNAGAATFEEFVASQEQSPHSEAVRSAFAESSPEFSTPYDEATTEELEEPDWATPISHAATVEERPRKKSLLNWWRR